MKHKTKMKILNIGYPLLIAAIVLSLLALGYWNHTSCKEECQDHNTEQMCYDACLYNRMYPY